MNLLRPKLWQIPIPTNDVLAELPKKEAILNQRLKQIEQQHKNIYFASSLAVEDIVITDLIAKNALNIAVFTLDTGMLNPETLELLDELDAYYPSVIIQRIKPQQEQVMDYINKNGKHAYYESVPLRKQCCFIRKIELLNKTIEKADAWLTGQRREQSVTRQELAFHEHDEQRNIAKYNPIFDWSEQDTWAYIQRYNIPYNKLYNQGYPSIGCEPCTQPVKQFEDIRSGRWWWENKDTKECGLHK